MVLRVGAARAGVKPNLYPVNIPSKQIAYRRKIGTSGSRGIYGLGLVGGLHVVAADRAGGEMEILGMGSHPLLARHIAKRHIGHIDFNDMAKSETINVSDFADLLPYWVGETAAARAIGPRKV
jgi:hypothetical protein